MSDNAGAQLHGIQAGIAPSRRIGGYVVEQQAGAGGMATVYRARDEVLGRAVALKVLAPALAFDQDFRVRFLRESRAIAAVPEPYITTVSIPDSQHYTELDLGPGGREPLLGDPGNSQVSDFTRFFLWGSV